MMTNDMNTDLNNLNTTLLADGRMGLRRMLRVALCPRQPAPSANGESGRSVSPPSTINHQLSTTAQPVLDFLASTGAVDRFQEIIEPEGWKLDSYRLNPVFQNAHRYGDVLFTLGKALVTEVRDIGEGRKGLYQRIEFATECNPIAKVAYGLYQGGFLNAVSVGFIPLRWEDASGVEHTNGRALSPTAPLPGRLGEAALPQDSHDATHRLSTLNSQPSTPYRRRYLEQELLEVSAVAIPANSEALALGLAEGAITRSAVQEVIEVLGATLGGKGDKGLETLDLGRQGKGALGPQTLDLGPGKRRAGDSAPYLGRETALSARAPYLEELWNFARELRAAMRK